MKKLFNVNLYRSPLFKIIQGLISLYSALCTALLLYVLISNLVSGVSLYQMFYEHYANSFIYKDVFFYGGTYDLLSWIFSIVWYLIIAIISLLSLINNNIAVFDDHIKIRFAPRYLNKVVNIKNITDISPVEFEAISVWQRILNFNFSKKHLYKITTKYKQCIIISCVDETNLNKLKEIVENKINEEVL